MIKTPCGKNAILILNVHHAHDARKFYKNFIRFSLDILNASAYCKHRYHIFPAVYIATIPQGILFPTSEGAENG